MSAKGDHRDFDKIEAFQSYWEELDVAARIEVLGRLMEDKCKSFKIAPPTLRASAEIKIVGKQQPKTVLSEYVRRRREIVYYYKAKAKSSSVPTIDRIDLALEAIMYETAQHIVYVQESLGARTNNRWQNESNNRDGLVYQNIQDAASQWMHEYLSTDGHFVTEVLESVDPNLSWSGSRSDHLVRELPPEDFNDWNQNQPDIDFATNEIDQRGESDPVLILRHWLRDPNCRIGKYSPVGLHREYLHDIWDAAMRLTNDDPSQALVVATEAVKSNQQDGESRDEYLNRLEGIPSKAFGSQFTGVDKVQHFFRCAKIAYEAGESTANLAGWVWEAFDWIGSFFKDTGGIDPGDLWADNLGAAFGAALRSNPDQSISRFLKTAPEPDEALVVRLDTQLEDGYIVDIIVPAPEAILAGHKMEVRAVDAEGYPYTMHVSLDPERESIDFERCARSAYRLSRYDAWYFAGPEDEKAQAGSAAKSESYVQPTKEYQDLTQRMRAAEAIRTRLHDNLDALRANQDRLDRQMQQQHLEEDIRRSERQQRDLQDRIKSTNDQLDRNTQLLNDLHQQRLRVGDDMLQNLNRTMNDQHQVRQLQEQIRLQQEHQERERIHREGREQQEQLQRETQRRMDEQQREINRCQGWLSVRFPPEPKPPIDITKGPLTCPEDMAKGVPFKP